MCDTDFRIGRCLGFSPDTLSSVLPNLHMLTLMITGGPPYNRPDMLLHGRKKPITYPSV